MDYALESLTVTRTGIPAVGWSSKL